MIGITFAVIGFIFWSVRVFREALGPWRMRHEWKANPPTRLEILRDIGKRNFRISSSGLLMVVIPFLVGYFLDQLFGTAIKID